MKSISLKVIGWRGLTHSFSIVNQFQLLGLRRFPVYLFHEDAPFPNSSWGRTCSGSGFHDNDQSFIDAIPPFDTDSTPDIVYSIYYPLQLHKRQTKIKNLVFSVNEYQELSTKTLDGNFYNAQAREDTHIVTPSHWSKEGYLNWGFDSRQVHVIPHGVDTTFLKPKSASVESQQTIKSADDFLFLTAGTLTFNKGVDLLLKAFLTLSPKYKSIKLCIKDASSLGYSTTKDFLKGFFKDNPSFLKLFKEDRLVLVSGALSQEQMKGLYWAADCYVSPYRAEGFGLTPLEAASVGVPIIVTKGGSTDEYFNSILGYSVESKICSLNGLTYLEPNLESLIHAMEACYLKSEVHSKEQSHRYVSANHSWDVAVSKLHGLLTSF